MAFLSTLSSSFASSVPADWTAGTVNGTSTIANTGSAFRVTAGTGAYRYYHTTVQYSLLDEAISWARFAHDGSADAFFELTLGGAVGSGTNFVYAQGSTLHFNGGTLAYDPTAHAWVGFKYNNTTGNVETYTAPDAAGSPGTPTLRDASSGSGLGNPAIIWCEFALGTLGAAAWAEIGAFNASTSAGPTPTITRTPTTLTFSGTAGGSSPAAQTVAITNTGTGALSGLSATIAYGSGAGWLGTSFNTTTAPATLTVTPTLGSLAAGTYTATISILSSASGVTNSPQTVTVTFTVAAAGAVGGTTACHAHAIDAHGRVINKPIGYAVDRPDLVTISSSGLIQAISNPASDTVVTVTARNGAHTATATFTVTHTA